MLLVFVAVFKNLELLLGYNTLYKNYLPVTNNLFSNSFSEELSLK